MLKLTRDFKNTYPKERDIVETTLQFFNGKEALSFAVNVENLGVACEGLDPPLYPMACIIGKSSDLKLVG